MHRPRKLGLYFKDLGLYIFLYNTKPVSMRIRINELIFLGCMKLNCYFLVVA